MGTKEFALGAELALRGAGIKDDRVKQQLMAQVTQAQLQRSQQEMAMQQKQQDALANAAKIMQGMTAPRQEAISPWEPSFGTRTVTPQVDFNQLATAIFPQLLQAHPVAAMQMFGLTRPQKTTEKTPNEYGTFYKASKEKGMSDEQIADAWQGRQVEKARQTGAAQTQGKMGEVDTDALAKAVVEGRENIENIKNAFGIAVQAIVQSKVLKKDPQFNFNFPRANIKALSGSMVQQQKVMNMMGSFVRNINKQLDQTDKIMNKIISRVGIRAIDLPIRELRTRIKGSGEEKVIEAYLVEISNEIGKLSTGSAASIRELSTDAQERWATIHDPNLSLAELKKVLDETRLMANMRLESTREELDQTMQSIQNSRQPNGGATPSSGAVIRYDASGKRIQ